MSEKLISSVVSVLVAVIGVAIVAVLVSKHADTANVITSGGSAFDQIMCQVLSPLSGGGCTPNVSSSLHFPTG